MTSHTSSELPDNSTPGPKDARETGNIFLPSLISLPPLLLSSELYKVIVR